MIITDATPTGERLQSFTLHHLAEHMEPDDQYLCIVADSVKERESGLFLPFEGDQTLALIISKAFLLAADSTISDPTITSQILNRLG